jgi:hypothetical protein
MDAPKCRLCGEKHYGVDHVFDLTPLAKERVTIKRSVTKPVTKPQQSVTKVASVTKPTGRPRVHKSNAERQRAYRVRKT